MHGLLGVGRMMVYYAAILALVVVFHLFGVARRTSQELLQLFKRPRVSDDITARVAGAPASDGDGIEASREFARFVEREIRPALRKRRGGSQQ